MENIETVAIGEPDSSWQSGLAKTITFIVTEACQLRCGYCYIIGKNETNRMTFTVAKASVDYILRNRKLFNEKSVIWDFIGGEADATDKIGPVEISLVFGLEEYWEMVREELGQGVVSIRLHERPD